MTTHNKLTTLRTHLAQLKLDGYIQPLHDEFMSEYPPAYTRRLEWLTGFTGSAGTVVVLKDKAAFFTDGRYTLQAAQEVDGALYERHNLAEMAPDKWLEQQGDIKLGYDPLLFSQAALERLRKAGVKPVAVDNCVDAVWKNRPAPPHTAVIVHPLEYAGKSSQDKRAEIARALKAQGADAALLATPESVNWLLNVRGNDVQGTPVALSVAIISADAKVSWCIHSKRCGAAVIAHIGSDVQIIEPEQFAAHFAEYAGKKILCDARVVPVWYRQQLEKAGAVIVDGDDPCVLPKAMKNSVELQGIRDAHVRDGAAVVKLLAWLDAQPIGRISELDVCARLLLFRKEHALFREPSFNTIAGSGPHGAIVHYRADEKSNRTLQAGELFLLDSGGQYPDGTTDITRTLPIGTPTKEHKEHFTRVLKGHIALALAEFDYGTPGSALDPLARQFLYEVGLDYEHGTGHGVGHYLGVHEGPQRISKRDGDPALEVGMVISNEPGYYKTGEYGIRIENLVAVMTLDNGKLGFETLTCVPIDTRLVDVSMLGDGEKSWLNGYHAWVENTLSPALTEEERRWLAARCAAC